MAGSKDKKKKGSSGHGDHGAHGHDAHGHDAHDAAAHLSDSIELSGESSKASGIAFGIGAVALCLALAIGGGPGVRFQHAYLAAFMWGLSIAAGAVWWVTLQHLVNAKWSIVVRRLGEFMAQGILIVGVLALPILGPIAMGHSELYSWLNHDLAHHLGGKAAYLNKGFFIGRMVFYFAFWTLLAKYWLKQSVVQEAKKDASIVKRLQGTSAPMMIVFALSITFCAIDFLMTLDPIWFSTIFGVYFFATCVLTFHSSLALFAIWLQKRGHLTSAINQEHYHDIGKMMFAFTAFWTYIAFSQFMLIWYANIPEETMFFKHRAEGGWKVISLMLPWCHFAIPFLYLMSWHVKRNIVAICVGAVWLLVVCWFDMYWLVAPRDPSLELGGVMLKSGGLDLNFRDLATSFISCVGVGGILAGFVLSQAKGKKLLATGDPRLSKSLTFQNI